MGAPLDHHLARLTEAHRAMHQHAADQAELGAREHELAERERQEAEAAAAQEHELGVAK